MTLQDTPAHKTHSNNPELSSGSVAGTRGGECEGVSSGVEAAMEIATRVLRRVGDEAASAAII